MAIKLYKPTTPGRRKASVLKVIGVKRAKRKKSLTVGLRKKGGRSGGRIAVRHKGGGHKRLYRQVDFMRSRYDQTAIVKALEYDPNRNALIALIEYEDKSISYILAPDGLKIGEPVVSSLKKVEFKNGNRMPLELVPSSFNVYNIELTPGRGGKLVRGAGTAAVLQNIEGEFAQLKMPSGELRLIAKKCLATIGQVSNPEFRLMRLGKAGRKRWLGIRPSVGGKSMNPVDHPHGGGEGHAPIGMTHPKTPWGKPALGVRTRQRRPSDKLIIKRRKTK
jgi:large subunit ribosomal protein L2